MIQTSVLKLANGTTVDLLAPHPAVPIGMSGVVVTTFEGDGIINAFVCPEGQPPVRISDAVDPRKPVIWPATLKLGVYTVVIEQWAGAAGRQDAKRPAVALVLPTSTAKPPAAPVSPAKPPLSATPPTTGNVSDGEAVKLIHVPYGFACSGSDDTVVMRAGISRIASDGGGVIRVWHGGFGSIAPAVVTLVDTAVAAGLDVILTVNVVDKISNPKATTYGRPDIAGFVAHNAATLRKCKFVEAGNELNINQYRPDDFGDSDHWHAAYVAQWLQPLSTALTAIGVQTLCASVTGDSNHPDVYGQQLAKLVAAGASKYCVGYCVHCYWHADKIGVAGTLVPMLVAAQTTCGLPVHITEAGLDGSTPEASFPAAIVMYLQDLRRAAVASISVYRGGPHPIWPASRSLFDRAGRPTAIYPVVIGALKS